MTTKMTATEPDEFDMMTERMTAHEFEMAASWIVGHKDRGWKQEAAAELGVSVVTISNALKDGPGLPLTRKAMRAMYDKRTSGVTVGLPADMGPWVTGEPETRRRDGLLDVVVMHMNRPRMTLYARQLRDGLLDPEYSVEWSDTGVNAARKAKVLDEAKEKARAKLAALIEARIVAGSRDRLVKSAERATGYEKDQLELMSHPKIAALRHGAGNVAFIKKQREELEAEARSAGDAGEKAARDGDAREALEQGTKFGSARILRALAFAIEVNEAGDAESLYTARQLEQREFARDGTVRGRIVDRGMHRTSEFDRTPEGGSRVMHITASKPKPVKK